MRSILLSMVTITTESESFMTADTANTTVQIFSQPIVQTPLDVFKMKGILLSIASLVCLVTLLCSPQSSEAGPRHVLDGKQLFERDTFAGNGRTCRTCHSQGTGTVSPRDAQKRFRKDPNDPLFLGDGSDDGLGHGVTRMLMDATVLVTIWMRLDKSKALRKRIWFVILLIGFEYGSVLYYFCVYRPQVNSRATLDT